MSYGEDGAWGLEDRGQFIAMLRDEVIKKRNVVFVAAAGNSGESSDLGRPPYADSFVIRTGAVDGRGAVRHDWNHLSRRLRDSLNATGRVCHA